MRADRLLSILMLLQTRGRTTAADLASELEVSTRTIYRDVDALSAAGIPVYVQRGPGGGIDLLEAYRTDLTGLSDSELQAMFMLAIPAALVELGVEDELRTGMQKLIASLSGQRQVHARHIQERVHLDSSPWHGARSQSSPILHTLHHALMEDRQVRLRVRLPFETQIDLIAEPYALVAKQGSWHLVFRREGRIRVISVSKVLQATLRDVAFKRSESFNLLEFWKTWCRDRASARRFFLARLRVSPQLLPYLLRGGASYEVISLEESGKSGNHTWNEVILGFEDFYQARTQLLGFGGACQVLEPAALRLSVADFAGQIVKRYEPGQGS
jgi:predicted DNA-binding transcriptional regulator YafY